MFRFKNRFRDRVRVGNRVGVKPMVWFLALGVRLRVGKRFMFMFWRKLGLRLGFGFGLFVNIRLYSLRTRIYGVLY